MKELRFRVESSDCFKRISGIHRIAKTVRMEYAGKTHSGAKRKESSRLGMVFPSRPDVPVV
ncbi:hypothetical protein, partial [Arthrobacter citreus]|uniref:hypothetical protein n=1 Tax=Arthrobacter citreus TaxID=1670 RepID=UPI001B86F859